MLQTVAGSEDRQLNDQLREYRKKNSSLRRKLKEKDNKIQQLFGYIEEAGRPHGQAPSTQPMKQSQHQPHQKGGNVQGMTESRRKQKENKNREPQQDHSIFRQPSHSLVTRHSRLQVHLPSLERKQKPNNIFQTQDSQNPQRRRKVVRIPIQKLKPLKAQQVKLRFLKKYPHRQEGLEQ